MSVIWILVFIYLFVGFYVACVTMWDLLGIHDNSKWWQTIIFTVFGGLYVILLWPLIWRRG